MTAIDARHRTLFLANGVIFLMHLPSLRLADLAFAHFFVDPPILIL
jgi:hypothetical protein